VAVSKPIKNENMSFPFSIFHGRTLPGNIAQYTCKTKNICSFGHITIGGITEKNGTHDCLVSTKIMG
jgi:hypothetical protein